MEEFLKPYSTYSEYDPVEDLKINDIIGKPSIEYEDEKFSRLTYKTNEVVI